MSTPPEDPVDSPTDPSYCAYTSYESGPDVADLPATGEDADGVERRIWDALAEIEDPEMPISIVDLGLIYGVTVEGGEASAERGDDDDGAGAHVRIRMTLTYTGCPARDYLLSDVEQTATAVDGVADADVELVWSPEWSVEMVTDRGREDLREFGVAI